jgi:hypothetical protein
MIPLPSIGHARPDAHGRHTFRPSKLVMRVRFPSPAPTNALVERLLLPQQRGGQASCVQLA